MSTDTEEDLDQIDVEEDVIDELDVEEVVPDPEEALSPTGLTIVDEMLATPPVVRNGKVVTADEDEDWFDTNDEEDIRPMMAHPFQPLVLDPYGVIRFKENKIVKELLDRDPGIANAVGVNASGLNRISYQVLTGQHSHEDYSQLMQLIGYSVGGYCDLTIVPKADRKEAQDRAITFRAALGSFLRKDVPL